MIIDIVSQSAGAARASCRGRPRSLWPRAWGSAHPEPSREELPRSLQRAAGLVGFHGETVALASPARAAAAARAFAAGNGYLPGLIVDRLA
jgi:hypothetical protein